MSKTCGESISSTIKQTATLLKSFNEKEKEYILSKSNISKAKISAEEMISLKANMSSTYVNMKILSRYTRLQLLYRSLEKTNSILLIIIDNKKNIIILGG